MRREPDATHTTTLEPARPPRVLLIEDDVRLAREVAWFLGRNGLEVHSMHGGELAVSAANDADIVVLDWMLDGLSVCRALRTAHHLPILMLTARGGDASEVSALKRVVGWQELMLQTVAHELRTPLARVRFVARRVADATDDAERADALGTLDADLTELEDLVSTVLSLVRADHGTALECVSVDVDALVRETPDRLARVHLSPSVTLGCVGPSLTGAWARVDPAAVMRVLDNLLRNAVAHAQTEVHVLVVQEDTAVMVAVEDDGEGLPDEVWDHAVEPFVQLDDDGARTGTGLGLAIVKGLAEAHGHPVVLRQGALGGSRVETRWPLGADGAR